MCLFVYWWKTETRRSAWPLNIICLYQVAIFRAVLPEIFVCFAWLHRDSCVCLQAHIKKTFISDWSGWLRESCQLTSGIYLPILNYFWLLICIKAAIRIAYPPEWQKSIGNCQYLVWSCSTCLIESYVFVFYNTKRGGWKSGLNGIDDTLLMCSKGWILWSII